MTVGEAAATHWQQMIQSRHEGESIWRWLCTNECFQNMISLRDRAENARSLLIASNSEKRRWIEQKSVRINGTSDWKPDDPVPNVIYELVFFPKGKHRITMV